VHGMAGGPCRKPAHLVRPRGTAITQAGAVSDAQQRARLSGVWATAVGVARVRALETERENALFRDPLAQVFAAAGGLWPSSPLPANEAARRLRRAVSFSIVIRTRFLDDLLQQASASGIRQVVW
jgi:O-methyltransferase involved in polyketide biosynthesis